MTDAIPKKSLGQHWLHDAPSLEDMCDAADVRSKDVVLEIGPGLGTLTEHLIERAKQVIAVEFDHQLALKLPKRFSSSKLQVIEQDILSFDFTSLPSDYKVVANIPYYLTSHLIRLISETPNQPVKAALLVQKEVAERLAAKPGKMSLLSVTAQYYWNVELKNVVIKQLFTPPPKVDSQIVVLCRRQNKLFSDLDDQDFFRLVRAGYSQRRKTLLNSLSAGLRLSKDDVSAYCHTADVDPKRRAQTLSLEEWHGLYLAINP